MSGRKYTYIWIPFLIIYIYVSSFFDLYSGFFLFFIGVSFFLFSARFGVLFFITVYLSSNDIALPLQGDLFTIHTIQLFGLPLLFWWIISMLVLTIIKKKQILVHITNTDKYLSYMVGVFLVAGIIGIPNLFSFPRIYISDISWLINTLLIYILLRVMQFNCKQFDELFFVIVYVVFLKGIIGITHYVIGIGVDIGGNIRAVVDSIRNIFPLLLLCFVGFYAGKNKLGLKSTYLYLIGFIGAFNVVNYASRTNILLLGVGIFLIFYFYRKYIARSRAKLKILSSASGLIFIVILGVGFMYYLRPDSLNFIFWKLNTFSPGTDLDISASSATRYLEAINIFQYLKEQGAILYGSGLGGYFEDNYLPYTTLLVEKDAYNEEWILNGTIFKPHGAQLFIFLKSGMIGLLIYGYSLYKIFKQGVNCLAKRMPIKYKLVMVILLSYYPIIIYKNFNTKLQVFMGIVIFLINYIDTMDRNG